MLSETEAASICRAKVLFTLPGTDDTFQAVVDSGSEANILSMDFVTESNLSRYLRPVYVELFPIGDKMLPSNFQISLPIKFVDNSEFHIVDFTVLNTPSKPLLGQPWLRENDLCIDIGFTSPGVYSVHTSKESKLPYFSTPLIVESLPKPSAVSMAVQFSRYSVPYLAATIGDNKLPEELLLDTGAMVNILSTEKYEQLSAQGDIELQPSKFRTLKGAGTSIKVLGQVTLKLNFIASPVRVPNTGDEVNKTVQTTETFVVAEDPGDDFTLGLNFIASRSWLLDPLAAVLLMPDGYGIELSYPRDRNVMQRQVQFDHRQSAVKIHLATLQNISTLSAQGLGDLASECSAVANHYNSIIQNPTLTMLDLAQFIEQPQFGVEAYHKKMVYQWIYDHPKHLMYHLGTELSKNNAPMDYPKRDLRDGPLLRSVTGNRKSDQAHLLKDALSVTRDLLFPFKRLVKVQTAPVSETLPPTGENELTIKSTNPPRTEEAQTLLSNTPRDVQTPTKGTVTLAPELHTIAEEKEPDLTPLQLAGDKIVDIIPDTENDPQILALKQPHTNCLPQPQTQDFPQPETVEDKPPCASIPTFPLPTPECKEETTQLPLRDFFHQQIELEKHSPGSIKQHPSLLSIDTMEQPLPGSSKSTYTNPSSTPTNPILPFLVTRP